MSTPLTLEMEVKLDKAKQAMAEADQLFTQGVANFEDKFSSINDKAAELVNKFTSSASGPAKEAGNVIGLLISGSIIAAMAGVATSIELTISALAKLGDRADDLRLPVNLLQALGLAADQARVPAQDLNKALDQFTEVSKKSADDAEKFYEALGNVGDGFVKAFKDAPTQAARLGVIADALKSTTDEVKRAQLAHEAFGSDNERLISIFAKGSQAISDYVAKLRELGIEVDRTAIKQAQEAKSQLDAMAAVMRDRLYTAIAQLIPAFMQLLPILERIGTAVKNAFAGLVDPEFRPRSSIVDEIAKEQAKLEEFVRAREALGSGDISKFGFFDQLISSLGDPKLQLAKLDENIAAIAQRIEKLKTILDRKDELLREAARPGGPGAPEQRIPAFQPRPGLGGGEDSNEFTRAVEQITKRTAEYKAEAEAVGLDEAAKIRLKAITDLEDASRRAGIPLTEEQKNKIEALAVAEGKAAQSFADATQKFQQQNETIRFGGDQLISMMDGLRNHTETAREAMLRLGDAIIHALEQSLLLGSGPLAGIFGTAAAAGTGGTGGLLGSLLSGFGGAAGSGGMGKAGGGDIDAGRMYLVGESGPELLTSRSPATVLPNGVAAAGGAGGGVTINNYAPPGTSVTTQRRQDGNRTIIDQFFSQAKAGMASGLFDGPMRARYGAAPQTIQR